MHLETLPQSKESAALAGSLFYFSGEPCRRGHMSPRYTNGGSCKACSKMHTDERTASGRGAEMQRRAKAEGRKPGAGYHRQWRIDNPGKAKAADKKHREERLARDRVLYWAQRATSTARNRSKIKGVPFDISAEYVRSLCPTHCPALGCELIYFGPVGQKWNTANLDRIRPELGYTIGNVQIISSLANRIKTDANAEQVTRVAAWMRGEI